MPIEELQTSRLHFRRFTSDDLHALAAIRADPDVMKYIASGKPESIEEVQAQLSRLMQHWDQHGFGRWALVDKSSGTLAGWCGLSYLENTSDIEIGYGLAKPYWGKGLASEAAAVAMKYGFEQLRLERIVALAWPENIPSQRIMQKLGMKYVKRDHFYGAEMVVYVIFRKEYEALNEGTI